MAAGRYLLIWLAGGFMKGFLFVMHRQEIVDRKIEGIGDEQGSCRSKDLPFRDQGQVKYGAGDRDGEARPENVGGPFEIYEIVAIQQRNAIDKLSGQQEGENGKYPRITTWDQIE